MPCKPIYEFIYSHAVHSSMQTNLTSGMWDKDKHRTV